MIKKILTAGLSLPSDGVDLGQLIKYLNDFESSWKLLVKTQPGTAQPSTVAVARITDDFSNRLPFKFYFPFLFV